MDGTKTLVLWLSAAHYPRGSSGTEVELEHRKIIMALTKSQLIEAIAEKASVERKTAETMLDCLAQLAYENAKDEFTVPRHRQTCGRG